MFARTTAVACSVSRGRYSLGTKLVVTEVSNEAFAFSALPNTAQQIEAAQHPCELPETGRTCVTVLGAARGVGGIDSWGTDVEAPYHVNGEQQHSVSLRILL